jgi:hypothetical protein
LFCSFLFDVAKISCPFCDCWFSGFWALRWPGGRGVDFSNSAHHPGDETCLLFGERPRCGYSRPVAAMPPSHHTLFCWRPGAALTCVLMCPVRTVSKKKKHEMMYQDGWAPPSLCCASVGTSVASRPKEQRGHLAAPCGVNGVFYLQWLQSTSTRE